MTENMFFLLMLRMAGGFFSFEFVNSISFSHRFLIFCFSSLFLFGCASKKDSRELYSFRLHSGAVTDLAFSASGDVLASAGDDSYIRLFDLGSYEDYSVQNSDKLLSLTEKSRSPIHSNGQGFTSIDFMSDGQYVAASQFLYVFGGSLQIFDISTGDLLEILSITQEPIKNIEFNRTSDSFAIGTGYSSGFGKVFLYFVSADQKRVLHENIFGGVNEVIFSSNGDTVISVGNYGTIFIDSLEDETRLSISDEDHLPYSVSVSPYSRKIFSVGEDSFSSSGHYRGSLHIWDSYDLSLEKVISLSHLPLRSVSVSPNGSVIAAAGDDHFIYLVRLDSYDIITLRGHFDTVNVLKFSPDSLLLASGSDDGFVFLWDVRDVTNFFIPVDSGMVDGGFDSGEIAGIGHSDLQSGTWNLLQACGTFIGPTCSRPFRGHPVQDKEL